MASTCFQCLAFHRSSQPSRQIVSARNIKVSNSHKATASKQQPQCNSHEATATKQQPESTSLFIEPACQATKAVRQHNSLSGREACRGGCGSIPLLVEVIWPGCCLTNSAIGVCRVAGLIICKHLCSCLRLLLAASAAAAAVGGVGAGVVWAYVLCGLVKGCICTCAEVISRYPVPAAGMCSQRATQQQVDVVPHV
jgi:hypothetical protein